VSHLFVLGVEVSLQTFCRAKCVFATNHFP